MFHSEVIRKICTLKYSLRWPEYRFFFSLGSFRYAAAAVSVFSACIKGIIHAMFAFSFSAARLSSYTQMYTQYNSNSCFGCAFWCKYAARHHHHHTTEKAAWLCRVVSARKSRAGAGGAELVVRIIICPRQIGVVTHNARTQKTTSTTTEAQRRQNEQRESKSDARTNMAF